MTVIRCEISVCGLVRARLELLLSDVKVDFVLIGCSLTVDCFEMQQEVCKGKYI